MATFTTSACQTSSSGFFLSPPKYIENGLIARSAAYTFTAAQSAGDVIQMIPVPKGAQVIDVRATPSNMGGVNFTFGIGDGGSTTRYANSLSTSANGAVAMLSVPGVGYSYSVDDTVDIIMQTATSASAAGTIRLTVLYTMDAGTGGQI